MNVLISVDKADEITDALFRSLLSRYQTGLEASMKGSDFFFDCVQLLCYKRAKTNFKGDRSYLDSPDWIKNRKETKKAHL